MVFPFALLFIHCHVTYANVAPEFMTVLTFVRELSLNLHLFICSHKWFRNMVMLHTLFSGDVSGAQAPHRAQMLKTHRSPRSANQRPAQIYQITPPVLPTFSSVNSRNPPHPAPFLLPRPTEMKQELTTAPQPADPVRWPPAALEDEGVAHGSLGEALLEVPRLPGEDDWRERLDGVEHDVQRLLPRVLGELQRLLRLPAVHHPLPSRRGLLLRRRDRRGRGLHGGGRPVVL
jgi:hypothetical protein